MVDSLLVLRPNETLITVPSRDRTLKSVVVESRNQPKKPKGYVSATRNELVWFTASRQGTLWTPEERANYYNTLGNRAIGPGEVAYSMRMGYPISDLVATRNVDFPKENSDAKPINDIRFGSSASQHIYANVTGALMDLSVYVMQTYNKLLTKILIPHPHDPATLVTYQHLFSGGITVAIMNYLKAGDEVQRHMAEVLTTVTKPSEFVKYSAVISSTEDGFIRIPASEFDEAFKFKGISKKEPTYKVSRSYLERRAREAALGQLDLFIEQSPNSNAINAHGNVLAEVSNITISQPTSHLSSTDVDCLSSIDRHQLDLPFGM